jgi:hypothetical protein
MTAWRQWPDEGLRSTERGTARPVRTIAARWTAAFSA